MAFTTSKMGLTSWNLADDDYDYQQLANNWQIVDFHDHTPGRGVPVGPGGIGTGAVLSQNIAAGVVNSQHLSTQLTRDLGVGANGRGMINTPAATTVTTTYFTVVDQLEELYVDANSLIGVIYQALWSTTGGNAYAGITINGAIVPMAVPNGAPTVSIAPAVTTSPYLSPIASVGLGINTTLSTTANSSEVSTGQFQGYGLSFSGGESFLFFETAGNYNIGVGYSVSSSSYTCTVQNRHLWVRTINFE